MMMRYDDRQGSRGSRRQNSYSSGRHHDDEEETSTNLLDHYDNRQMPQHEKYHEHYQDYDDVEEDASVLSFQRIRDERDYDRFSYARKRSEGSHSHSSRSSPDRRQNIRGGDRSAGGGGSYVDDYYYDDDNRQSRSRKSYEESYSNSYGESSISYIDYNDSFNYDRYESRGSKNQRRHHYSDGGGEQRGSRSRSYSPSATSNRVSAIGSTIRTHIPADGTTTSTITFDYSGAYSETSSRQYGNQSKQPQQPFVGHDGQLVEHSKFRSSSGNDDIYSIASKPHVITVPSPDNKRQQHEQYMHKNSLDTQHLTSYSGREHKAVNVHEMGSRRKNLSKRRSRSYSTGSSHSRRNNLDRKHSDRSRSSGSNKRRSSHDGRSVNKELKRGKSGESRHTQSTKSSSRSSKSRRSKDSSGSRSSDRHKRRSGRSRENERQTRGKSMRALNSNGSGSSENTKSKISSISSSSNKERRQRDRRRDMMTGRATKHLLEDDDSHNLSHYSRSSVRHDVDDEGYCLHHPEIELMRLKSDGFWSTVRKKCPECIHEDCPTLMGGGHDHEDEQEEKNLDSSVSTKGLFQSSRLFNLQSIMSPEEIEEEEELNRLKRRLAARAYHFPGNTWCEDWMQYLSNTHTVLGLFFHHPLHPLKVQERLVILFGSIAIGLTISNLTYLYFIHNEYGANDELFTLNSRHSKYTGIPEITVTKVMITLWTLGSFLHTVFDLSLWHMKACTICRYGGLVDEKLMRMGRVVGLFIVMIVMGVGGYAVLLRATIEYKGEGSVSEEVEESIQNNEVYQIGVEDKRSFRFLLGYLVEFVLALFVYYPVTVTIIFSGVLGCNGRIPILGGRPREMKKEQRYLQRKRESKILRTLKSEGAEEVNGTSSSAGSYGRVDSFDYFDENQVI